MDLNDHLLSLFQVLNSLDPTAVAFRRTLRKLQGICASQSLLPSSHILSNDHLNIQEEPFASGGYSDVYKGILSGLDVCVKELRVASTSSSDQARKGTTSFNFVDRASHTNESYRCFTERP